MGRLTITVPFYNTDTGRALPFSRLFFFVNNTNTPKDTFADPLLGVTNPNPVISDGSGQFGDIFLDDTPYTVEFRDRNNVTIWRRNNVFGLGTVAPTDIIIEEEQELTDGQVVVDLTKVNADLAGFYLTNGDVDQGRILKGTDYQVNTASQITLTDSYPGGTKILGLQFEPTTGTNFLGNLDDVTITNPEVDQALIFNGTIWVNQNQQVDFVKNEITDGRFDFAFEGTSHSTVGYGSLTMFRNEFNGSTSTMSQENLATTDLPAVDNPTAEKFARLTVVSAVGASNFVRMTHRIENVRSLAGQKAAKFLYFKTDSGQPISIEFLQNFGSGGDADVSIPIAKITPASPNTWERVQLPTEVTNVQGKTIGADSYLEVRWWVDAGSDFDTETDTLGQQSGTFDFACVQLAKSNINVLFIEEDFQQSLDRVNRYFQQDNTAVSGYTAGTTTDAEMGPYCYKATMRDVPNVTTSNFSSAINCTGVDPLNISDSAVNWTPTGRTAANTFTRLRFKAEFDARL